MKRIFVPTESGSDWQRLLAKPQLHWKRGASAMTAAAAWEAAADALPLEIQSLLQSAGNEDLTNQRLIAALPEWPVALEGGDTTSNTDVLAVCRNASGLCLIAVEAKVREDFGPLVGSKRSGATPGQLARLDYLHTLLQVDRFDDRVRYQLLHRTASALLTAREFHAATAVMIVHAFNCPPERRIDFELFATAMKSVEVAPRIYRVQGFNAPNLYLGWCDGDPAFLHTNLPNAVNRANQSR